MDKEDSLRCLYEEKYFNKSPEAKNSRVAPQTPGSKVLSILGFEKKGDLYPDFENKQITDIGGGLSTFAFELAPSVKQIIVVDPAYHYDLEKCTEDEKRKAENRLLSTKELSEKRGRNLAAIFNSEKEVGEGIERWKKNIISPDPKIILNDSFAQDLKGIAPESQDAVFLNFVLHTLKGRGSLEDEILVTLDNAYRITKPGGKVYGIHDKKSKEEAIITALNKTDYRRNAYYRDDKYMVFIIDKE